MNSIKWATCFCCIIKRNVTKVYGDTVTVSPLEQETRFFYLIIPHTVHRQNILKHDVSRHIYVFNHILLL